ncbi:hypothetical protein [Thalassospira australica]|uniref:hypothetical protein n=1 Tax=Thalassospira australica TaxID=1528106 RepID=UPI00384F5BA0
MTAQSEPIIRIHGIAGARSSCRVMGAAPFALLSPERAGAIHGAMWFSSLIAEIRRKFPAARFRAILDCRGRPSAALAAMELGIEAVLIDDGLSGEMQKRFENLGAKTGCTILTSLPDPARIYQTGDDHLPDPELDRRLVAFLAL